VPGPDASHETARHRRGALGVLPTCGLCSGLSGTVSFSLWAVYATPSGSSSTSSTRILGSRSATVRREVDQLNSMGQGLQDLMG